MTVDFNQTPFHAAEAAAEAIRTLNHLTARGGYVQATDISAVMTELLLVAERLPQALNQAEKSLYAMLDAGKLRDDRHNDDDPSNAHVAVTVEEVAFSMTAASVHLRRWLNEMQTAKNALSHIGGK